MVNDVEPWLIFFLAKIKNTKKARNIENIIEWSKNR